MCKSVFGMAQTAGGELSMRDVLISIPTLAYKDWRIFFNFGDEDEEDRAVRNLRREFPYRDDVEKVKR